MLNRTEGIVLKSSIFGEADLIVTYLTPDFGLLRVFVKSPRKTKSRFGSSIEPLTYAKIAFWGKEHANLPRLTQSDIVKSFHKLRDDYGGMLNIMELLEMNLHFLIDREPHPAIFRLLLATLSKLEADINNRLYYLYYKIRFLEISGYSPRLEICGRCGGLTEGRRHHNFYVSHGSIICRECIGGDDRAVKVTESALKFYKSIFKWQYSTLDRIKAPVHLLTEIQNVINSHISFINSGSKSFDKRLFLSSR
ncbi:MAG: DNA repair protein RecO [Nitrospirae bacterium]|nr:MAG: DNA repair protein RecO [Nitrospirota bacterium]